MENTVIFYTQIISIIAFIGALFGIYKSLVSNKDSLIELQKEKIKLLKEKITELEGQTTDALAESLSRRVEIQLSEIERLNNDKNLKRDASSENINKDSIQVIVQTVQAEIKGWKDEINRNRIHKWAGSALKRKKVTGYLGSKTEKKQLYSKFVDKGGTEQQWTKILSTPVDDELYDQTIGWTITQWRHYVLSQIEQEP